VIDARSTAEPPPQGATEEPGLGREIEAPEVGLDDAFHSVDLAIATDAQESRTRRLGDAGDVEPETLPASLSPRITSRAPTVPCRGGVLSCPMATLLPLVLASGPRVVHALRQRPACLPRRLLSGRDCLRQTPRPLRTGTVAA